MVHQHVLPPLSEEFRNHKMIPFVLPLVLLIAEDCTLAEFAGLVLPVLTPAMKVLEPIQVYLYSILLRQENQSWSENWYLKKNFFLISSSSVL